MSVTVRAAAWRGRGVVEIIHTRTVDDKEEQTMLRLTPEEAETLLGSKYLLAAVPEARRLDRAARDKQIAEHEAAIRKLKEGP